MARRVVIGIALGAIGVVVALVVLGSDGSTTSPDAYAIAANRLCLTAQHEMTQTRRRHRSEANSGDPRPLARSLFWIVGRVRTRLEALNAPPDRIEQAVKVNSVMLEYEGRLSHLVHLETLSKPEVRESVEQAEAASARIRNAASSLGLAQCSRLALGISPSST